jgi:hypothetical protein
LGKNGLINAKSVQILGKIPCRGIPLGWLLGHRLEHDRLKILRNAHIVLIQPWRFIACDLAQQFVAVSGIDRWSRSQQFGEGGA